MAEYHVYVTELWHRRYTVEAGSEAEAIETVKRIEDDPASAPPHSVRGPEFDGTFEPDGTGITPQTVRWTVEPEDEPDPTATVLVHVAGGMIDRVDTDGPVRVLVADYDVESYGEHEHPKAHLGGKPVRLDEFSADDDADAVRQALAQLAGQGDGAWRLDDPL